MFKQIFALFIFTVLLPLHVQAAAVMTEAGPVSGHMESGLTVYKGIPYAAPPLGALRWRAPEPHQPWKSVWKATSFAPACSQKGVSMPGEAPPKTSEDCLYLNIWAPPAQRGKALPVIAWIPGGGFVNGSAAMPLYWGDRLARRGVIVVTIAYRLGVLGFFAHPDLAKEASYHSSGNYGLLDQIAALAWIKRNIAAFGGDPARVTVAGQSAGATSVSLLMASPLAKGLFQQAIAQSGGLFEPVGIAPQYMLANAEHAGAEFGAAHGAATIDDLRRLPAAAFIEHTASATNHPVIDSYVVPEAPYEVFAAGRQIDIPLIVGSNTDEARSLVNHLDEVTAEAFTAGIHKAWGPLPDQLLNAYPHATDMQAKQARLDFERDLRFGWDVWTWARLQSAGHNPVYSYRFAHAPPFPAGSVYANWGAAHFSELWYMFDHLDQDSWSWSAGDRKLADEMSSYWTNFVKSGNPNGPDLPKWPQFDKSDPRILYLDDPVHAGSPPNLTEMSVFDTVYGQLRSSIAH